VRSRSVSSSGSAVPQFTPAARYSRFEPQSGCSRRRLTRSHELSWRSIRRASAPARVLACSAGCEARCGNASPCWLRPPTSSESQQPSRKSRKSWNQRAAPGARFACVGVADQSRMSFAASSNAAVCADTQLVQTTPFHEGAGRAREVTSCTPSGARALGDGMYGSGPRSLVL